MVTTTTERGQANASVTVVQLLDDGGGGATARVVRENAVYE